MQEKIQIKYKKLNPLAKAPTQAKDGDAGYDLYSTDYTTINPFERKVVKTGLAIQIPRGYYGRVAPRSGLAVKSGVDILAGVIDSGYRNEVGVVLINFDILGWLLATFKQIFHRTATSSFQSIFGIAGKFEVKEGDKVAQLIIEKCHEVEWIESETLDESERGLGGFGSTG